MSFPAYHWSQVEHSSSLPGVSCNQLGQMTALTLDLVAIFGVRSIVYLSCGLFEILQKSFEFVRGFVGIGQKVDL